MNFQKFFKRHIGPLCLLVIAFSSVAAAQVKTQPTPTMVPVRVKAAMPIATGNNLYCAGYIQSSAISTVNKIIGANGEADQYNYSQNGFLFLNMGASKGVNVGDTFAVVRPRGKVKSKWSKKGALGFYVQEVGAVEIVAVKPEISVARVKSSCDNILLGDLVQFVNPRISPLFEQRPPLDLFRDPSGKATGRILMARDMAEALTRDYIVYVDLGADTNVQIGDHLTIFRPLGKGNLFKMPEHEDVTDTDYGFHSEVYSGGKYSNQAGRKSGEKGNGPSVTTARAKKGRPSSLRKVVGEAVVLNVKERTATVVITRTAQEIHTGDWVEIQ